MSNILIIDDQPSWQEALKVLFEKNGFNVSLSSNYEDAEKTIALNDFDLVILDIRLNDEMIGNFDGIKLFLNSEKLKKTQVIILSGYLDQIRKIKNLEVPFFEKGSFNNRDLIKKVKDLLAQG